MHSNENISINNQPESSSKKKLKLILLILIPIILIIIVVVLVVLLTKKNSEDNSQPQFPETGIIYNLSTFFFFDPVSSSPCNEKNYWTQFDNTTTCYRWISNHR